MKILWLLLPAIFLSCFTNLSAQENEPHQIKIVAHRGASKYAPENTIPAFLKAAEMGADYAEMDVRQTKDGIFILMHDKTINRTTNGKGIVEEMTLDEIRSFDAGSWFSEEYKNTPVPTLQEALIAMRGKILPDIDFKAGKVEDLVKLLEDEGYLEQGNVTFYSNWDNAKKVRELTNQILVRPSSRGGESGLDALIEKVDPQIVNVGKGAFSEFYINEIHRKGKLAFVNALRRADKKKFMKRAIAATCDFLQADNLNILIPLVQEYNKKGTHH